MLQPEYYEKGELALWPTFHRDEGAYFLERLHPHFDPETVLALPIIHPFRQESADTGAYGRSFAVLTISANHRDSALTRFNPRRTIDKGGLTAQDRYAIIKNVYSIVYGALNDRMSEIVGAEGMMIASDGGSGAP